MKQCRHCLNKITNDKVRCPDCQKITDGMHDYLRKEYGQTEFVPDDTPPEEYLNEIFKIFDRQIKLEAK